MSTSIKSSGSTAAVHDQAAKRLARESRAATALLAAGLEEDLLLPAAGCAKAAGISLGYWHGLVASKRAPQADVRLGARCVRWRASTIRKWLRAIGSAGDN